MLLTAYGPLPLGLCAAAMAAMAALDAITALGDKAAPIAAQVKALPKDGPAPDKRLKEYIPRLLEEVKARFP